MEGGVAAEDAGCPITQPLCIHAVLEERAKPQAEGTKHGSEGLCRSALFPRLTPQSCHRAKIDEQEVTQMGFLTNTQCYINTTFLVE